MKNNPPIPITSWEQLQDRITSIVAELNADRALAVAAAANPFEALEELGYHVDAKARPEIADRLRFSAIEAARRKRLRARVFEVAGHEFDLDSAEELRAVLYEELSITPFPDERGCYPDLPDTRPPARHVGGVLERDPLRALEGRHPIIEPLLDYRRLDATRPRFAPQEAYESIRTGEVSTGIIDLRIRFKGQAEVDTQEGGETPPPQLPRPKRQRGKQARLNINSASTAELESLPGISTALAAQVAAYREEHGRFETPDSLGDVPGIDDQLLTELRPHITTEP